MSEGFESLSSHDHTRRRRDHTHLGALQAETYLINHSFGGRSTSISDKRAFLARHSRNGRRLVYFYVIIPVRHCHLTDMSPYYNPARIRQHRAYIPT